MAEIGIIWRWILKSILMVLLFNFISASGFVSAERVLKLGTSSSLNGTEAQHTNFLVKSLNFLWQPGESGYQHVWPVSSLIQY